MTKRQKKGGGLPVGRDRTKSTFSAVCMVDNFISWLVLVKALIAKNLCFAQVSTIPTLVFHINAYWLVRPPYLGSQVGRQWAPAGRDPAGQRRAEEPPAAGACSSGPRLPWRQRRAGRVQIGSLVWRHRDLQRKGWHCWWRREPGWWPKGMMGSK